MKKRLLSILMALALCLTLLPAAAQADGTLEGEGTYYQPYLVADEDDLKAAVELSAKSLYQTYVRLTDNIELTETIEISNNTMIHLWPCGQVLTMTGSGPAFLIEESARLEIEDFSLAIEHRFTQTEAGWRLNDRGRTTVFGGTVVGSIQVDGEGSFYASGINLFGGSSTDEAPGCVLTAETTESVWLVSCEVYGCQQEDCSHVVIGKDTTLNAESARLLTFSIPTIFHCSVQNNGKIQTGSMPAHFTQPVTNNGQISAGIFYNPVSGTENFDESSVTLTFYLDDETDRTLYATEIIPAGKNVILPLQPTEDPNYDNDYAVTAWLSDSSSLPLENVSIATADIDSSEYRAVWGSGDADNYETLLALLDYGPDCVQLTADITLDNSTSDDSSGYYNYISRDVTLDLNGHILSVSDQTSGASTGKSALAFFNVAYGELTLTDSSREQCGAIEVDDTIAFSILSRMRMTGGTIRAKNTNSAVQITSHDPSFHTGGCFLMEGGILTAPATEFGISAHAFSTITADGGTINGTVLSYATIRQTSGTEGTVFNGTLYNAGLVSGGIFKGAVLHGYSLYDIYPDGSYAYDTLYAGGTITGGSFYQGVTVKSDDENTSTITGGIFYQYDENENDSPIQIEKGEIQGHTITFLDGEKLYAIEIVPDGKAAVEPEEPTGAQGYVLTGWFNGEDLWNFGNPVDKDMSLSAKWAWKLEQMTITVDPLPYTGRAQSPTYTVTVDGNTLTEGMDYLIINGDSVVSATEPGNYTIKLRTRGAYDGVITVNWSIDQPISSGGSSSVPSYTVTAPETENGSVTVSPKRAEQGDTVTITVTPDSGYTLETLTVLDKNGKEIELTAKGNGKYTFKMPSGKLEIRATFMEDNTILNFFVDVTADKYYYDAVLWAAKNGITGGIDENHFGPDLSCTRAQLVTFLWRAAGSPAVNYAMDFSDVDANAYYGEAIRWAASLGIVGGYGNGLFGTGDDITREQFVTILYRFAVAMGMDTTQGGMAIREFADYESISGYAAEAMQWAVNAGILQGSDGKLMPKNNCTRAQIVTMLYRLLGE